MTRHTQVVTVRVDGKDEDHLIEVVVDMAELARRYASKAVHNKSGVCRECHGAVLVNDTGKPGVDR